MQVAGNKVRFALASDDGTRTPAEVAAFLPGNYGCFMGEGGNIVIVGRDRAGWTLTEYVLPRLASAMIVAQEVSPDV